MRLSFEITRGAPVEKGEARPPNVATTSLSTLAQALTTDGPATGTPPNPGALPAGGGDAAPIRWPFAWAVNQTLTPRGEDRRLTPFQQLRTLADVCDIVRIAIEARKDQITALSWDFAPRQRSNGRKPTAGEEATVKRLREFFRKPDKVHGWNTWIRTAVEEVLVIDALSIFRRKTRGGGAYALEVIDGTTIKPLLNERGFVPAPPLVAYRQIIHGQAVKGGDCTTEQLFYRPRTVRTWTPYGLSATESVMLTVNTVLNRQVFNLGYFSEGNIPEGLASVPEGWTTDQIRQFQEYWDTLMGGNYKMRQRLRFVGHGMAESVFQFKKESFDTKFDEWLLQVVCAAFGVQPQELGFTQQINKSQGEQQENITYRRGIKPLAGFVKDILDEAVADDLDAPEFEAIFTGGESEDRKAQAEIDKIYWQIGVTSTDEIRQRNGEDQVGLGPVVMTAKGPVFVEQLVKDKDNNPLTSNPRDLAPPDDGPGAPARGQAAATSPDEEDPEADVETAKAVDAELGAFRRYLANRVAKGRGIDQAATAFESDVLPLPVRASIVRAVQVSKDAAGRAAVAPVDVATAFEQVEKVAAPKRIKVQAQAKYRRFLKSYFGELADALGDHLGVAAGEE
jgi:hypothetical protein